MKKNLNYTLFLLIFTTTVFAQPNQDKRDKIKALKIAYISEELALSTQEAEKFWPIYNTFEDKQFELQHQKMKAYMSRIESNIDKLTEKEAAQLLAQMENTEDELFQLRKKYNQDLKTVLSAQKIVKLHKAEEQFRKNLLKQFRSKRPEPKN
jgi:Spy/CpxP family protein refolding chaperone